MFLPRAPLRLQWLGLYLTIHIAFVASEFFKPFNVSYDHRALIIDGKRRMLISGGIHYPRATPEMWSDLISKSKEGGVDVIQTYVFWNGHEPQRGQYNFDGRYDIVKFVKLVGSSGLYLHLRIGPYVCAEWNFGGFPVWLRDIPGIEFRTNNAPFKITTARKAVTLLLSYLLFTKPLTEQHGTGLLFIGMGITLKLLPEYRPNNHKNISATSKVSKPATTSEEKFQLINSVEDEENKS